MRLARAILLFGTGFLAARLSFGQDHVRDFEFESSGAATVPTTNGVVFEARINGQGPFRLIFDSGAGVNILNPAVVAKLGLPAKGGAISIPAIGGAVDSKSFGADDVQVGALELHRQTFYSMQLPWPDGTGPVGAVGYELMRQLVVTVDYANQRLTFFDPASFSNPARGHKIALVPDPTQVVVNASVGGRGLGDFVIDTGDFGGVSVNSWFVKKSSLLSYVPHRYHGIFGKGAGGDEPPGWIARVKSVCVKKTCAHLIIAYLSDVRASWDMHAGTIGADTLKRFTVTIDWPHHELTLEKNRKWGKPEIFNRTGILDDFDDDGKSLKVVAALANSPADRAGVRAGDRILLINHKPPVQTWGDEEPEFLGSPGTVVSITTQRGAVVREVKFRLKNLL